jgi:hypothetical protein
MIEGIKCVMAGLVPAIHAGAVAANFPGSHKRRGVDARHKAGHDEAASIKETQ